MDVAEKTEDCLLLLLLNMRKRGACIVDNTMESIFAKFSGRKDEIIPLLQAVQEEYGYIPEDAMLRIARFTRVPESKVYGAATFYAQFRFTPMGIPIPVRRNAVPQRQSPA